MCGVSSFGNLDKKWLFINPCQVKSRIPIWVFLCNQFFYLFFSFFFFRLNYLIQLHCCFMRIYFDWCSKLYPLVQHIWWFLDLLTMQHWSVLIVIVQFEDVQFFGGKMFHWLRGKFPAQISRQARGDLCPEMCWEVPEAFDACWHEICRAEPRCCNPRLIGIPEFHLHWLFCCSTCNCIFTRVISSYMSTQLRDIAIV